MARTREIVEVDLIASGYEWECPNCEKFNREIETSEQVKCTKCKRTFNVSGTYHAEG